MTRWQNCRSRSNSWEIVVTPSVVRRALTIVSLAIAGGIVGLCVATQNQPMQTARHMLDQLGDLEAQAPVTVIEVIGRVENPEGESGVPAAVQNYITRCLLILAPRRFSRLQWIVRSLIVSKAVALRMSDKEQFALYASLVPFEEGTGLANAAQFHFARPLRELSPREVITLLAVGRAPKGFSPRTNPQESLRMQQILWDRYAAATRHEDRD